MVTRSTRVHTHTHTHTHTKQKKINRAAGDDGFPKKTNRIKEPTTINKSDNRKKNKRGNNNNNHNNNNNNNNKITDTNDAADEKVARGGVVSPHKTASFSFFFLLPNRTPVVAANHI